MKLSCVTASYVMDLLGYPGHFDWGGAQAKIADAPLLPTIEGMLDRLAPADLDGIEFWYPHIAPDRLTPRLASAIRQLLASHDMVCSACAGAVPNAAREPYACEELFQVASLLRTDTIAGHMGQAGMSQLTALCAQYQVRVGYENGGEKTAQDILAVIGGADSAWIGANIDTGNMAVQGGDPVQAIRELGPRIKYVHLKDVPAVGDDECVALGTGIVNVRSVIRELKALDYEGWISIEIENSQHDPTADIIASAATVRRLMAEL